MEEEKEVISNRVAESGLVSLDLENFYEEGDRIVYDLKDNLYQGLILKEKDFRAFIKEFSWSKFSGKIVAITCSVDAIIPSWAYMLLVTKIAPLAKFVMVGSLEEVEIALFQAKLNTINVNDYKGAKIVIKGCSDHPVPLYAYGEITRKLLPVAGSIMFGEPCSTVPVYKIAKNK